MRGKGVEVGDGVTKATSAPSCFELQQYCGGLTAKFGKFWIGNLEQVCAIRDNVVIGFGDGKSKENPAPSCQDRLDAFGLKNGEKFWLKHGATVAQAICTCMNNAHQRAPTYPCTTA